LNCATTLLSTSAARRQHGRRGASRRDSAERSDVRAGAAPRACTDRSDRCRTARTELGNTACSPPWPAWDEHGSTDDHSTCETSASGATPPGGQACSERGWRPARPMMDQAGQLAHTLPLVPPPPWRATHH
jgi:hypothetical protein